MYIILPLIMSVEVLNRQFDSKSLQFRLLTTRCCSNIRNWMETILWMSLEVPGHEEALWYYRMNILENTGFLCATERLGSQQKSETTSGILSYNEKLYAEIIFW